MESETIRNDPDSENRLSVGGRKRSSRRSSILKKSPVKPLEDIDPNSIGSEKENRDKKSRRSSMRRVSFAQTHEVKEFCKDDGWNEWQKAENRGEQFGQDNSDYIPSEYRQPNVTIRGLQSLLTGDIQNPYQIQNDPEMDLTLYCSNSFNEPHQAELNRQDTYCRDITINELDLTCHGKGMIDQENIAPNASVLANYDEMDLTTVCQTRRHVDEVSFPSQKTTVFPVENQLDMTCHGQGNISTNENSYQPSEDTLSKFSAASFLHSLRTKNSQELRPESPRRDTSHVMIQETKKPDALTFLRSLNPTKQPAIATSQRDEQGASDRMFLQGLVSSAPSQCQQIEEEEESMEMTTCMDVPLETTDSSMSSIHTGLNQSQNAAVPFSQHLEHSIFKVEKMGNVPTSSASKGRSIFQEAEMDMTACVPLASRSQRRSMVHDAPMDMTAIAPPTSGAQQSSMYQEAEMDMTACVPLASRSQRRSLAHEAPMDMTACIPSLSMSQGHLVQHQHTQIDTSCIPSVLKSQQEALIDMSSVALPTSGTQRSSIYQEAQMDMTTCVSSVTVPQGQSMASQEGHMEFPSGSKRRSMYQEAQMDMTTCIPSSSIPQGQSMISQEAMEVPSGSKRRSMYQEAQMDMTTCIPSSSIPQTQSMACQKAQMQFSSGSKRCSIYQEAQMDMTSCVPPTSRPQSNFSVSPNTSMSQETHMDMTGCVASTLKSQEHQSSTKSTTNNHDLYREKVQVLNSEPLQPSHHYEDLNAKEDLPEEIVTHSSLQLEKSFESKRNIVNENKDEATRTSVTFMETTTNKVSDSPAKEVPKTASFKSFKAFENYNQSFLSRTLPLLGSQRPRKTSFQSLPMLSSSFLVSEPSNSDPQITHGPVCDIPISKYCSQTAKKRKVMHDNAQENCPDQSSEEDTKSTNNVNPVEQDEVNSSNNTFTLEEQETDTPMKEPQETDEKNDTFVLKEQQTGTPTSVQETREPSGEQEENNTYVLENEEAKLEVPKDEHDNSTYVLEKEQVLISEVPKQVDVEENERKDTAQEHEECDEIITDSDGEISFKAPTPGKTYPGDEGTNITETLAQSTVLGLIDEPTMEFTADVFDETENNANDVKKDGGDVQESVEPVKHDSQERTLSVQNRKSSSNLSVICEESEAECSKGPNAFSTRHEDLSNKKTITVAELFQRASISLNPAIASVQSSRRSIFGCIQRPEKPKEEKEFIQLSMALKPQALHYGEFCATIQKEIEQLKNKTKEQEQELNNSDNPILYYTDEEEMAVRAKKLKELKKTVCKESASARWIERSGVMKKKLASVLKSNREDLSNDVNTVNDCLAVAQDCDKLLDNIDDELEKGMQSLRESLINMNEENTNIEEIRSTVKQKAAELEARETELQQLEEKRSSLISTRETLTAEKENLEREQFESEALLAKTTKEVSLDKEIDELEEKHHLLKQCLEWELDEWDENHAKFLFLHQTLELLINFEQRSADDAKTVTNISLSSRLADDSHKSAKFAHSLIQRSVNVKELIEMSPTSSSLSKVLDHVSAITSTARTISDEVLDVCFTKITTTKDNSVSIMFSSVKNFLKFFVELTIDVTKYPENVQIAVTQKIGKPCCQEITDALNAVPAGQQYITRLVDTAKRFLE